MVKAEIYFSVKCPIKTQEIENMLRQHLKKRGIKQAEIEVLIESKTKMESLNLKYMKRRGPTDVLSFPLPKISKNDNLLGTIVVCCDIIKLNSQKHKVSFRSEFEKVLTHGADHLIGIHHK